MKAEDNPFPHLRFVEGTTPATPPSGNAYLFIDTTDGLLKRINDAGTVTTVEGGGGSAETWQTYVPVLTATSNPTLGTGSSTSGAYVENGDSVHGWAQIVFGTSGVAVGSGTYKISLPVAHAAADSNAPVKHRILGCAEVSDNSASLRYHGHAVTPSNDPDNVAIDVFSATTAVTVTHAVPWTWQANDSISIEFTYRK